MLYTHIKQTDIISHTRGETCNQTFNLHFHTLPSLQHQDKKIYQKTIRFVPHRLCFSMEWDDTGIYKKSYAWRKADKRAVSCHVSLPRKLISTNSISCIIIFTWDASGCKDPKQEKSDTKAISIRYLKNWLTKQWYIQPDL